MCLFKIITVIILKLINQDKESTNHAWGVAKTDSKHEEAEKIYYEGIKPLLHILSLRGVINHEKLPDAIWTDAYIQGFFMSLIDIEG